MRQAVIKLDKTLKEYKFLCENHIDSPQELVSFITEKREQIGALEKLKAQGKRTDLTLSQVATKSDTAVEIGKRRVRPFLNYVP